MKRDELVSSFAFKFNLRRYTSVRVYTSLISAYGKGGQWGKAKLAFETLIASGRALHSSTSQLNLSRFWSQMPQEASTSRLNLRRFCL